MPYRDSTLTWLLKDALGGTNPNPNPNPNPSPNPNPNPNPNRRRELHPAPRVGQVTVVYEMHDGIPTLSKWVEVRNGGREQVLVETLVTEELHVTEDAKARLHVETDYMPRKTAWEYAA